MHTPERSLLLIRHGQSEWNAIKRWQGIADSPLTDLGRRQAAAIGRSLAAGGEALFSTIASSDLTRASDTAAIIADELGLTEVASDERLREADAGPWQGMTPAEIAEGWPGFLEAHRRPDGFETAESVVARAIAACTAIIRGIEGDRGRSAIAVTHSGLIRALRRHLGAADESVPNLGGVWVDLRADELHLGPLFAVG
ncbi:MAG: histidine phosphatase family protein, partial [Ilumatobacteraceae bacterium]